jgi:hypothetical protein
VFGLWTNLIAPGFSGLQNIFYLYIIINNKILLDKYLSITFILEGIYWRVFGFRAEPPHPAQSSAIKNNDGVQLQKRS